MRAGQVGQDAAALGVFFQIAPDHEQGGANAMSGEQVSQAGQTPAQDNMPNLVRRPAGQPMNAEVALDGSRSTETETMGSADTRISYQSTGPW